MPPSRPSPSPEHEALVLLFRNRRTEGRTEGLADALIDVLESRGLTVSTETRARILACTDETTLRAWLGRAATVDAVDALFATES